MVIRNQAIEARANRKMDDAKGMMQDIENQLQQREVLAVENLSK